MKETAERLQEAFAADAVYASRQRDAMNVFHQKMTAVDPAYLKLWELDRMDQEAAEAKAEAAEGAWVASVRDLYAYAANHHADIKVHNGALDFASAEMKADFESRLNASKGLNEELVAERKELVEKQNKAAASVF
jgi:hypothetical protein